MNRSIIGVLLIIAFAIAALFVELVSAVPQLWSASLAAFLFAVALGWHEAAPVMAWIVAINMLSIWADIFNIDLTEHGLGLYPVVRNQEEAILYSLAAMAVLALGMLVGQRLIKGNRDRAEPLRSADVLAYSASRIALLYFASFAVAKFTSVVGNSFPGLSQPAYAFALLKFAFIYWLSITVFVSNRNYIWLIVVMLTEIIVSSTTGFSRFTDGFFVVLIAAAESKRRLSMGQLVFALVGAIIIIYMSIVWISVKWEFRKHIISTGAVNSVTWLASKYANPDLATWQGASKLLARVGYTQFYAMALNRDTKEFGGNYERAVEHVLMPRLLFPNKAALDDSAEMRQIFHMKIDKNTSISLGYVAQAHIDFGFPGLLLPIFVLGAIVGAVYSYFLTRSAPAVLCRAIGVACVFNCLRFEGNIEQEFGGLLMTFVIMAIILRYGNSLLGSIAGTKQLFAGADTSVEGNVMYHHSSRSQGSVGAIER
jgi:hypothetical protein